MPSESNAANEINTICTNGIPEPTTVIVRTKEVLIVILFLVLWAAVIVSFFNRWGKIRLLEPYQPKFQQQQRQSCTTIEQNQSENQRTFSKCGDYPTEYEFNCTSSQTRPRQNSSSVPLLPGSQGTPRRTKSAFDLQFLILSESNATPDSSTNEQEAASRSCKPANESTRLLLHERKANVCQSDRTETTKSPLRDRRMSICQSDCSPRIWQRNRRMSVCQFDCSPRIWQRDRRMSVCQFDCSPRIWQRDRRMSVCQFDRMDAMVRLLQRDRVSSAYYFDRMDVLARPNLFYSKSLTYKRRVSTCNFLGKNEEATTDTQLKRRMSSSNVEGIEKADALTKKVESETTKQKIFAKCTSKAASFNHSFYQLDQPSCSKNSDTVFGYKATCV